MPYPSTEKKVKAERLVGKCLMVNVPDKSSIEENGLASPFSVFSAAKACQGLIKQENTRHETANCKPFRRHWEKSFPKMAT